jgi:autotransporter-associated beta strand protein
VLKGGTVSTGTGTIALVGASTITGTTAFSTIATPISGTGSLTIGGNSSSSFVTLSGNNSYSGGTTLNYNAGMGSSTAFGTGLITTNRTDSNARINNVTGGLLTLANNVTTGTGFVFSLTGSPIQLTGTITGSGIIRASSSGIIDLTQQTASTMQNTGSVDMGGGGIVWTSTATNFGSTATILFSGTGATLIAKANTGSISQAIKVGSTGNAANTNVNIDTDGYAVTLGGVIQNLNSGTGGGLTKSGSGTLTLTNANTYTGATTVSAGSLLVNGALDAASTVTVASAATLGGSGTIGGNVLYSTGANFAFDSAAALTVNGATVTFGGFSVANVLGIDSNTAEGTYTLMSGLTTFDLTNVSNLGSGSAASLGGGKTAYLQSLSSPNAFQLVVVPEPSSLAAAGCGGLIALLVARRGLSRRRPAATDAS